MALKLSTPVSVIGMISVGTICSLLAKLIYSIEGPNRFGEIGRFEKPWFQVLAMFFGMSLCILLDLPKPRPPPMNEAEERPLLPNGPQAEEGADRHEPSVWIISIPTLLDLFATACGTTGLLYTTVSVYQMLRGAMLVWTALLSVIFLRRVLSSQQWGGITLCVSGIVLVGIANIASEGAGQARANVALGVGIILVGQVLQAAQVVIEEYLLRDLQMSSVRIVAWEGLFGVVHCLLWVFPIVMLLPGRDHGRLEDVLDAFYMLAHSWKVLAVVLLDASLMLLYNVFGMEVTENLSAVHRVVIETLRTLCVWVADLVIYYVISNGTLGEAWTMWSWLQLAGFTLLIAGTVMYNYENLMSDYRMRQKKAALSSQPADSITDTTEAEPIAPQPPKPKIPAAIDVEGGDEDSDDDEARSGSFMGHPVGSASHASYLVVGTPGSYHTPRSYPGGLRHRPRVWPRSPL